MASGILAGFIAALLHRIALISCSKVVYCGYKVAFMLRVPVTLYCQEPHAILVVSRLAAAVCVAAAHKSQIRFGYGGCGFCTGER